MSRLKRKLKAFAGIVLLSLNITLAVLEVISRISG